MHCVSPTPVQVIAEAQFATGVQVAHVVLLVGVQAALTYCPAEQVPQVVHVVSVAPLQPPLANLPAGQTLQAMQLSPSIPSRW